MSSQCLQNFHTDCLEAINRQINMELYASYVYLSMVNIIASQIKLLSIKILTFQSFHFDRDDIALPGISHYFKKCSDEEREHAMTFMKYLNKRGGRIILSDVKRPEKNDWGTAEEAMQTALHLEKDVNGVRKAFK